LILIIENQKINQRYRSEKDGILCFLKYKKLLERKGHTNSGATSFGMMDDLTYSYYTNSNRLKAVADSGNTTYGFKNGANTSTEYTYDNNGNMLTDQNKGITNITYNHLNLPKVVTINGSTITYTYDAAGTKLRKVVSGTTTDYAGNFIYNNNNLQFFNTAEGYFNVTSTSGNVNGNYVYQYKDHLGSIRLSYSDTNNNGSISASTEIIEESNYYPFGLKHKGYNNVTTSGGNSTAQKYGYTGKEHQDELSLNWIDITARNYDAALGRWMNLDPLAEKMRRHSPYNYAFNNPIYYIDPDGMAPCPTEDCNDPLPDGVLGPLNKKQKRANSRDISIFLKDSKSSDKSKSLYTVLKDELSLSQLELSKATLNEDKPIDKKDIEEKSDRVERAKLMLGINLMTTESRNSVELEGINNKIDSVSKEITSSNRSSEVHELLANMDRKNPAKMTNGGIGAMAGHAMEASRHSRDSVRGVKLRNKLEKKKDSIIISKLNENN
jgi:RHS repeat-associated protein